MIFIVKDRPEFQKGKINLIGGHIEPGEEPIPAAIREIKEETGLTSCYEEEMGLIYGDWGQVHCIRSHVEFYLPLKNLDTTEPVFWEWFIDIKDSPNLQPNLKVIIPLMLSGVKGWKINDPGPNWKLDSHNFSVTIPIR